ncbi:hypothetical protein TNCV_3527001 [Trichonephila clavipes]|nr:hypothetical protein TNCV_3527001 [Trichonephila clavipes]
MITKSPKWSLKSPTWSPKMTPTWLYRQDFAKLALNHHYNAVGSLVVRASDSRPVGLGSMPYATKYPPSTHEVRARKISGSESLAGCITSAGDWRIYFPPLQFHAKIVEGEIGGVAIYRPFREFRRANSYCHLYGVQGLGQRQAYF